MAKGVYLVNPELNKDEVVATATSELGRRSGNVQSFQATLVKVDSIGDPGDDLNHDFQIFGSQQRPQYAPLDASSTVLYTAPNTFADALASTIPVLSGAKVCCVTADDRLYIITSSGATGETLNVYHKNGTAIVSDVSISITDSEGGLSACSVGKNIYIIVGNNTDGVVEMYRFNTESVSLGQVSESILELDASNTNKALAIATSGSSFVIFVTRTNGAGPDCDVEIHTGLPGTFDKNDSTIGDLFSSTWSAGGDIRCGAITWNRSYGYIGAFRTGTSTPGKLRLAVSGGGDDWDELKNLAGTTVKQPGALSAPWGNATQCAITVEDRRIFVYRPSAATFDGTSNNIQMHLFDGKGTWSAEVDADGGTAVDGAINMGAANWRGTMYFAWRSTSTTVVLHRNNDLTTTVTGLYRDLILGSQMFIAGIDDDTRTALFVVVTGSITAGDQFRVLPISYDYKVEHLLDDFLAKVWRGSHNDLQIIQFDAGSSLGFSVDTIALFRSNLPSITFKMSDDVTFASSPVNQSLSATVQTATVSSVSKNYVKFAANTFKGNEYSGGPFRYWVSFSSGGQITRIIGNTTDTLICDSSVTGASGTATIFRDCMGYFFSSVQGPYRYARLETPSVVTPEEYYEISKVLFGMRFEPPVDYRIEWTRRFEQHMSRVELKSGARFNTLLNHWQRPAWTLSYRHLLSNLQPTIDFFNRTQGGVRLFGFWSDPTALTGNQTEVYPMFFSDGTPELKNMGADVFELSVVVEGQI